MSCHAYVGIVYIAHSDASHLAGWMITLGWGPDLEFAHKQRHALTHRTSCACWQEHVQSKFGSTEFWCKNAGKTRVYCTGRRRLAMELAFCWRPSYSWLAWTVGKCSSIVVRKHLRMLTKLGLKHFLKRAHIFNWRTLMHSVKPYLQPLRHLSHKNNVMRS